jgi:Spy/CpxP family protein refolding chaperone
MKLPLRFAPLAFVLALAPVSASLVACSGATEQPHTSASAMTKAPLGDGTHGPVRVVGAALGDVALRADQRAKLETILKDADARHAATSGARKELVLAFADQVERGSIDRAALAPKIDAVKADGQKVRPEDLAALDQVHAILDKDQRAAFVDALEDHIKESWRGKHGRGEKGGKGKDGPTGMWRMKQMAERLQLTEAQRDQIKEKLKALHAAHEKDGEKGEHGKHGRHGGLRQAKQALESFKNDDFKAASLGDALGGGAGKGAPHATRMIDVAEAVLPVLTPEQRKIAADELRGFAARGDVPGEH